ncbi:hypothetical protein JX265_000260 [Neoarthrinium moseri]|uniref:Uncharacterized protein n=1 Tax=Neoarthrinium moseri TaxID=1658444 RepID=A0A9P9WY73_9PEZI|nr:hypothetical protein JX265_000260 [Neoarthrinium moseri]
MGPKKSSNKRGNSKSRVSPRKKPKRSPTSTVACNTAQDDENPSNTEFEFYHADDLICGLYTTGAFKLPSKYKGRRTGSHAVDMWFLGYRQSTDGARVKAYIEEETRDWRGVYDSMRVYRGRRDDHKREFPQDTPVTTTRARRFREVFGDARKCFLLASLLCWNENHVPTAQSKTMRLEFEIERCRALIHYEELGALLGPLELKLGNRPKNEVRALYAFSEQQKSDKNERIQAAKRKVHQASLIQADQNQLNALSWPPRIPGAAAVITTGNRQSSHVPAVSVAFGTGNPLLDTMEALDLVKEDYDTSHPHYAVLQAMREDLDAIAGGKRARRYDAGAHAEKSPVHPPPHLRDLDRSQMLPGTLPLWHPKPNPVRIIHMPPNGVLPAGIRVKNKKYPTASSTDSPSPLPPMLPTGSGFDQRGRSTAPDNLSAPPGSAWYHE